MNQSVSETARITRNEKNQPDEKNIDKIREHNSHQEIVATYIETMKTYWSQMAEEAALAEKNMLEWMRIALVKIGNARAQLPPNQSKILKDASKKRSDHFYSILKFIQDLRPNILAKDITSYKSTVARSLRDLEKMGEETEEVALLNLGHPDYQKETKFFRTQYSHLPAILNGLNILLEAFEKINLRDPARQNTPAEDEEVFRNMKEKLDSRDMRDAIEKTRLSNLQAGANLEQLVGTLKNTTPAVSS